MKPGRNDPCSCGSGQKFKKCCGAIIPLAPVETGTRQCGSCTACCDGWLTGNIRGHEMKPGTRCHFITGNGCGIYEERPQAPCREFVCGWLKPGSPFPESFRPDRLGVIIIPIKWRNQPALRLCSAGRDPDPALLQWMGDYSRRTGQPFFYEEQGETLGFGPPAFQQELLACLERGLPLW